VVEQRVKLFHQQKKIRFETSLLNWKGELYREFRMALPLNMTGGQVAYEVPFGIVRVGVDEMEGAAGERYHVDCRELHPRGIENWIGASSDEFGLTMGSSVAVADWIDPTADPVDYVVLQPVLLASRHSCHHEGNPYLQTGDHHFSFSVTSHEPGWRTAVNFGKQANEKLVAVWADRRYTDARLPGEMSFFSTDDPLVMISTVKKAEDSNRIVMRLVDMEGRDKRVNITNFVPVESAFKTSLIEEILEPIQTNTGRTTIEMRRYAIETVKLTPAF
jgi:alpha-mannosidase